MSVLLLILGLFLFVSLVVVHELGHFFAARRNGVEVEEFGIGFPPRLFSKHMKSGFLLSYNLLPLGGFVKLKGEHDSDTSPGSLGAASTKAKIKIMLAGVAMNLVAAFLLFTVLAAIGIPKLIDNQFTVKSDTKIIRNDVLVGYVEPGSPADKAGLQLRDKLITIQDDCGPLASCQAAPKITSAEQLPELTKESAGQKVTISYERQGKLWESELQLRGAAEVEASKKSDNPKGYLGISPTEYRVERSTWSSPIVAVGVMKQFTGATFKGVWSAISNLVHGNTSKASDQVSGPVGVFVLLKDGSLLGINFVLVIIAVISLTLAIMNVLPIPALDGGRLFVMLLFRAMKKPLTKGAEETIHGIGFAILMVLFVLITIVDVRRFF